MSSPLTADEILDQCFLEVRAKILEISATLDRIDRCDVDSSVSSDPRRQNIRKALTIANSDDFNRAEQIQMLLSDAYEENWNRPASR
jgi:hypothetical protein